jgi:hypothetical protein
MALHATEAVRNIRMVCTRCHFTGWDAWRPALKASFLLPRGRLPRCARGVCNPANKNTLPSKVPRIEQNVSQFSQAGLRCRRHHDDPHHLHHFHSARRSSGCSVDRLLFDISRLSHRICCMHGNLPSPLLRGKQRSVRSRRRRPPISNAHFIRLTWATHSNP